MVSMHLTENIGDCLCELGEETSAAGGFGVGGISTTREREGNGNCTSQAGTVTEVCLTDVNNMLLHVVPSALHYTKTV